MNARLIIAAAVLTLAPGLSTAEVADSAAGGFTIKTILTIGASPDDVYRALTRNVGEWWDPAHTYSRDSHNLTIDDKPMGCFCEKFPKGGGVRHMEVVFAAPGQRLGLAGALGPLQSIAATGNMTVDLAPAEGGTKLTLTYSVTGYMPKGMNTWAAPVDAVLTQQFTRLKAYAERGSQPK